ncbi:MAG: hypothetical protein IPK58_18980 [Acidobacteria bacterium]|nr:hypothetical protein [Acidobacteriota bacterium]
MDELIPRDSRDSRFQRFQIPRIPDSRISDSRFRFQRFQRFQIPEIPDSRDSGFEEFREFTMNESVECRESRNPWNLESGISEI